MRAIFKYPIHIADRQTVSMPAGAVPLTVQMQHGLPCLWAAVDTSQPEEQVPIGMCGTGHPMPEGKYIGTVQDEGFVWHYFDARDAEARG